jgi:hypothetical protein
MTVIRGIKRLRLDTTGDFLYFWYANNKGRGRNNCTIIRSKSSIRAEYSKNQTEVTHKIMTSAWAGLPNMSNNVLDILEIEREEV